ncbi:MAG: LemA family protein [Acidimicrobiia bacterium]
MGIIIGIAVGVVVLGIVAIYNRLVRLRNRTDNAWSQVDVQLKRRYDLIPNLVETVKGYASHERDTFEAVVKARATAQEAGTVEQQAEAEDFLTGALRKLFALAEDYPELRASENFQSLQQDLSETEDKISIARQIYNDTTLSYNNAVQTVPSNLIAGMFGFDSRTYFEVQNDARSAPEVSF